MNSKFRRWLHELWMQNCDEHREYGQPLISKEQYFKTYKYWLKREFRHQEQTEQNIIADSNLVTEIALDDKLDSQGIKLLSEIQNKNIQLQKGK